MIENTNHAKGNVQLNPTVEELSEPKYTRSMFFNEKTHEMLDKAMNGEMQDVKGTRSSLRRTVRANVRKYLGYQLGKLGSSEVAGLAPRKERRRLAKEQGVPFKPIYNN